MAFREYYTCEPLRATGALLGLCLSDRSDGKTFNIKATAIDDYDKDGSVLLHVRRFSTELEEDTYSVFMNDLVDKYPDKYSGRKFKQEKRGVKIWNETTKEWDQLIYHLPLTLAGKKKSAMDVNKIRYIAFDEYVPLDGIYLQHEMKLLLELWKSVDRDRDKTQLFCYGNKIDLFCPFFDYFGIPSFDMDHKKIRTYRDGTLAVQIYNSKEHRERRKASAFDRLVAGTSYDSYERGGILRSYDLIFDQPDRSRGDRVVFAFLSSTGEGSIWATTDGRYIVSQAPIRSGPMITDNVYPLAQGDQRQTLHVKLPYISAQLKTQYRLGRLAYESPEAFHAFEPIMRKACAV